MDKVESCALTALVTAFLVGVFVGMFTGLFTMASCDSARSKALQEQERSWQQEAVARGAAEYYMAVSYQSAGIRTQTTKWRWKSAYQGEINLED